MLVKDNKGSATQLPSYPPSTDDMAFGIISYAILIFHVMDS